MSKRFEYTLTREGDTTYFSIQTQPEEWRGKGEIFTTTNNFVIISGDFFGIRTFE
jgi:hypothetical protein